VEATKELLVLILVFFGVVLGLYLLFRIVSFSIFYSYFQAKKFFSRKEDRG